MFCWVIKKSNTIPPPSLSNLLLPRTAARTRNAVYLLKRAPNEAMKRSLPHTSSPEQQPDPAHDDAHDDTHEQPPQDAASAFQQLLRSVDNEIYEGLESGGSEEPTEPEQTESQRYQAEFWEKQQRNPQGVSTIPSTRVKNIMAIDKGARRIAPEAPVVLAKVCARLSPKINIFFSLWSPSCS